MKLQGHDLVTLILLPLIIGVASNLASTFVRNLWATRSLASLINSRDKLVGKAAEFQNVPMVDGSMDLILGQLGNLDKTIVIGVHSILSGLCSYCFVYRP
jgi:hypothetical protein